MEHNRGNLLSVFQHFYMHYVHLILTRSKQVFLRKQPTLPAAAVAWRGAEESAVQMGDHSQLPAAGPPCVPPIAVHVCLAAPPTPSSEAGETRESGHTQKRPWLTEFQPFRLFAVATNTLADGIEITLMGSDSREDARTTSGLESVSRA